MRLEDARLTQTGTIGLAVKSNVGVLPSFGGGHKRALLLTWKAIRMPVQECMPVHLPALSRRRFLVGLGAGCVTLRAWNSADADADQDLVAILNDTHIGEKQRLDSAIPRNLKTTIDDLLGLERRPAAVFVNGDLALRDGARWEGSSPDSVSSRRPRMDARDSAAARSAA